ncbi:MAG TPA: hypothetical protein PKV46_10265 [Candidatus Marinimicrobia bacterium]|jgi:hypothetical protein|nr:hypothetical protein [Candidatus Neomarinimicrobiota bacterium]
MSHSLRSKTFIFLLTISVIAISEVRLPQLLSDEMVLQRDTELEIWGDKIPNPVAVRYAWADNPAGANLYNKGGLPASPFRTDDF